MKRNLLIVDDSAVYRKILCNALSDEYDTIQAENGMQALEVLENSNAVSAVITDIIMPDMDGYELLKRIRNSAEFHTLPVIVITGLEEEASRLKAISLGANNFILKSYDRIIIKHCVENVIALCEAQSIIGASQRDSLTGLLTRESFFEESLKLLKREKAGYYTMASINVEGFKAINSRYGLNVGDKVLRHIAEVLSNLVKKIGGLCCRYSADRFGLFYPTAQKESREFALAHQKIVVTPDTDRNIRIRVGRYCADDPSLSINTIYDHAKLAEESVKGKYNTYIAEYDELMGKRLVEEQQILNDMGKALSDGEFEPWFQPQYNHETGALIGAEALVRWKKDGRYLSPAVFVPLFERNGFIYEMDKNIWEQVCRVLRVQLDEGNKPLPISVNISRQDTVNDDFVSTVQGLADKYGIPYNLLRLEITESAFSDDSGVIVDKANELTKLGFTLEIDDFGCGYSSLNTLKDVPAEIMKLDMRFLSDTKNNQKSGNIIESVVRMAKWLGMAVIAEGVEKKEQADYLKSIGCIYIQGYFYAKPMPLKDYLLLAKTAQSEHKLTGLETIENLDNNKFWDPESMDALIFNSYVGAACILEANEGNIEMVRATDSLVRLFESKELTLGTLLSIDWAARLSKDDIMLFGKAVKESIATKQTVSCEIKLNNVPGCKPVLYFGISVRVIATIRSRYLIYCLNTNLTHQKEAEQLAQEAERKQKESAQRLDIIMRNVGSGVSASTFENDKVCNYFTNERYFELLGYTKEQFEKACPNGMIDRIFPEDKQYVLHKYRTLPENGAAACEFRAHKRDESVIWLHCNGTRCKLNNIDVNLLVFMDITAERKNAAKIKDAEQLQAIVRNTNGGMAAMTIVNGTPQYFFFNDKYCAILGYTREEFIKELPNGIKDIILPEYEKKIAALAKKSFSDARETTMEFPVRRRDGNIIWLKVHSSVGKMETKDVPIHVTVIEDITTERAAQEQVRALTENLQAMMADIPGGFVRLTVLPNGKTESTYVNKGFCRLVGMTYEEITQKYRDNYLWGVHKDDREKLLYKIKRLGKGENLFDVTYRLFTGEGTYKWVITSGRAVSYPDGRAVYNLYYSEPTQHEKNALALKETLSKILAATMESSTDIVFAKNKDYTYICGSPAFVRFTGKSSAAEVVGKTDFELFPEKAAQKYREADEMLLSGSEELVSRLEPVITESGDTILANITKYIIRDSEGGVLGIYGIGKKVD